MTGDVAVVVIGRNEGVRLQGCLGSVAGVHERVYVDSGSSDGSVAMARNMGVSVVELDMEQPFTAARARNRGWQALQRRTTPAPPYVQFVDGDCELVPGWMVKAHAFLAAHADVAVVCGRRRERFPERSVYNRLCDTEWDTPVGEALACGGDALMRTSALEQAGGFRDDLIAGEEPELCLRLRRLGWRIWRLDAEMSRHDAAMSRFSQWWRRSQRAGFAFAQGADLHGNSPDRHWMRESRSGKFWGAIVPSFLVAAVSAFGLPMLWAVAIYPVQIVRIAVRGRGDWRFRLTRASFLILAKFAEASGQAVYYGQKMVRHTPRPIEYK